MLGVRGEDPAEAALSYGRLNAWLYPALGFLDRFVYLDFEQLRLLPDFGLMKNLLRISLGGMFQFLVATSAWILLMSIVGRFAGYYHKSMERNILTAIVKANPSLVIVGDGIAPQEAGLR